MVGRKHARSGNCTQFIVPIFERLFVGGAAFFLMASAGLATDYAEPDLSCQDSLARGAFRSVEPDRFPSHRTTDTRRSMVARSGKRLLVTARPAEHQPISRFGSHRRSGGPTFAPRR